jgi:D-tyrosyl-tRNA(Tyr) deacylase
MKAVVQRVSHARVDIAGQTVAETGPGLAVLVGVAAGDSQSDAEYLAEKLANLRIFEDDAGRMNLSVRDVGGSILAVSNFTVLADTRKGRRPSFAAAADPGEAEALYERLVELLRSAGLPVETGRFGERMQVHLCNDGPVTIVLESRQ